jgi:hypothetical protein
MMMRERMRRADTNSHTLSDGSMECIRNSDLS